MEQIQVPASLAELAYTRIRESILFGEMKPGERLTEEQLATRLGISKSPIREALSRLSVEGLVQIAPRIGTQVVEFNSRDIIQLFDLREALELFAVSLFQPNAVLVSELHAIIHRCEKHVATKQLRKFSVEDTRLHSLLVRSSRNRFLIRVFTNLQDMIELARFRSIRLPGRTALSHEQHQGIVQALEEGDSERAATLLREHIRFVKNDIVRSLESGELKTVPRFS